MVKETEISGSGSSSGSGKEL